MEKITISKIRAGRTFSILVPILVALILSWGNDYIMVKSFRKVGNVDLDVLERTIILSNLSLIAGLALAILISNMVFRIIIRQELVNPLQNLSEGMAHMGQGDYDYRISYEENDPHFEIYDDFNEMAVEMRRFAAKATSVDEGRKRLLLGISHDLRSPLTSILAYVQGLLDGIAQTEEKREKYLNNIKTKSLEIDRMVNRLFTFAKLDSDQMPMDLVKVEVSSYLRDYVEQKKEECKAHDFGLKLCVASNGYIMVDLDLFQRILDNLIDNSMKYCDKPNGRMYIAAKAGREQMKITLQDNGPGVEETDLLHLWEMFYRADTARRNPGESNGIGLAIVKKAVEAMNGKVSAKNAKEGGLQISIRIPLVKDHEEAEG